MPINFTKIFSDCWNFIRNQQQIVFKFTALYVLVNLFSYFVQQKIPISAIQQSNNPIDVLDSQIAAEQENSFILFCLIVFIFASVLITIWGYITFDKLSHQQQVTISETFTLALKKIIGVIFIGAIILIPLSIGVSGSLALLIMPSQSDSLPFLFLTMIGLFLFVRLNLAIVHYAISNKSWLQSIKEIWAYGKKHNGVLFIYFLIAHIFFPLISQNLTALSQVNLFTAIIGTILMTFISMFSLIFSYRFYSLFIQRGK